MTERWNDKKTKGEIVGRTRRYNRESNEGGLIRIDQCHYELKNKLQQILPPRLKISDIQTSNKYTTTYRISIYIFKVAH